jgi:hypothetical protein
MAEEKKTEKVEKKKVTFIERKMKAINEMESPAKKRFLAERVLNRKVGK